MNPCEQREKIDRIDAVLNDICIRLATIDERLKNKITDIDTHIQSSDKQGGWRDRLVVVENIVTDMKNNGWKTVVIGGIVGGLIGAGAPNAVIFLAKLVGMQ